MRQHPKPLQDLLLRQFRSNDALYEHLANLEIPNVIDMLSGLPSPNVPRITYALAVVEQLRAYGYDKLPFFDGLAERFPGNMALVEAAQQAYLDPARDVPAEVDAGEGMEEGEYDALPAELAHDFERLTGESATFLDVSYLAKGARRAKAVVKLRMKFSEKRFVGTGFLVASDTLLTAHHNLWLEDGEKADSVEAIFDYETTEGGQQREPLSVATDLGTAVGEASGDWAMVRLIRAQPDRPLAPLAEIAARVKDRVAIIQHPGGTVKQVSLHNNLVTMVADNRLQYLTDTLKGSSGAPIFDRDWRVIGIHTAGVTVLLPGDGGQAARNEGVPIAHVRLRAAALSADLHVT